MAEDRPALKYAATMATAGRANPSMADWRGMKRIGRDTWQQTSGHDLQVAVKDWQGALVLWRNGSLCAQALGARPCEVTLHMDCSAAVSLVNNFGFDRAHNVGELVIAASRARRTIVSNLGERGDQPTQKTLELMHHESWESWRCREKVKTWIEWKWMRWLASSHLLAHLQDARTCDAPHRVIVCSVCQKRPSTICSKCEATLIGHRERRWGRGALCSNRIWGWFTTQQLKRLQRQSLPERTPDSSQDTWRDQKMFVFEICLLTAEVRITSAVRGDCTSVANDHGLDISLFCVPCPQPSRLLFSVHVQDLGVDSCSRIHERFWRADLMCDLRRKAASRLRRESGLLWFFVCLVALVLRSEYVTGTDVARCAKHHKHTSRPPTPSDDKVATQRPGVFDHEVGIDVLEVIDSVGKHGSTVTAHCVCAVYRRTVTERKVGCPVPASSPARSTFLHDWRVLAVRNPLDTIEELIAKVYLDSL